MPNIFPTKKHTILMSALTAVLLVPGITAADPAAPYRLADLVVTESNHDQTTSHPNTRVLARENIRATGSRSLGEALRHIPGITVAVGRKNQPEPALHGFPQERMLVLIDGVPYYESNYGKLDLDQFPADIIARIEVLPATASVLYGPNAQGGVINVVTLQGSDTPQTNLNLEAGSANTRNASLSHSGRQGPWHYWISYTRREADGFRLSHDSDPAEGTITTDRTTTVDETLEDGGDRENADFAIDALWARLGFNPDPDTDLAISAHLVESERGTPWSTDSLRVFTDRPAFSDIRRFTAYDDRGIDLAFTHRFSDEWKLASRLFHHRHRDDLAFYDDIDTDNEIAVSTYRDELSGISAILDRTWSPRHTTRAGVHAWFDRHQQRDDAYLPFAESNARTLSLALEHSAQLTNRLSASIGTAMESFKVTDAEQAETDTNGDFTNFADFGSTDTLNEINPALNIKYDLFDNTELFCGIASRTRFPTLIQLYDSRSGNSELEAERSLNLNLGARQQAGDTLTLTFELFAHRIRDWISRDGSDTDSLYRNYAEVRMRGFTTVLEWCPVETISFQIDYTYNHASDRSDDRLTDAVRLVPKHKLGWLAEWHLPTTETRIQLSGYFVADTYSQLPSPSDTTAEPVKASEAPVINLRISQKLREKTEIYAVIDNILDRDYEYEDSYPAPGREFRIGLSAGF